VGGQRYILLRLLSRVEGPNSARRVSGSPRSQRAAKDFSAGFARVTSRKVRGEQNWSAVPTRQTFTGVRQDVCPPHDMSVASAKRCEFDSLGKMLRRIREWIAALSAPAATLDIPLSLPDFPIRNL